MTQPPQHSWMQTYTGQAFDPLHPDPKKINIEDIAHALSMNCRYAGHVQRFYSVAEHSLLISHAVSPVNALYGLLHDAEEAYLPDMVRPVKYQLPNYRELANNLRWAICRRFGLPQIEPDEVKELDLRIVVDEKAALMAPEPEPWGMIAGLDPLGVTIQALAPATAEQFFLARFRELTASGSWD
jgi:hypothetical protein